jgi:DNA (cytosine-5)-methyltransferase 1
MGRMSFPENLDNPARTVMATMASASRESMILPYAHGEYRLPTVRETATMMSFPLDYRFYGVSKGIKHTLVGNAVPPRMSFVVAKAIASDAGEQIPDRYVPIQHDPEIEFLNLNGVVFEAKIEKERRDTAKFKYHIPYLIISAYRVELTNYHSDFHSKQFQWDVEIHYSQGKDKAKIYRPIISDAQWDSGLQESISAFVSARIESLCKSFNEFQRVYCLTSASRSEQQCLGPYELLKAVREYIDDNIPFDEMGRHVQALEENHFFPKAILVGYHILYIMLQSMNLV